jgi:hypothetical protein
LTDDERHVYESGLRENEAFPGDAWYPLDDESAPID